MLRHTGMRTPAHASMTPLSLQSGGHATCCPPNTPRNRVRTSCADSSGTPLVLRRAPPPARVRCPRPRALPGAGSDRTTRASPVSASPVLQQRHRGARTVSARPERPAPHLTPRCLCRAVACCARAATTSARAATAACATPATPSCACPSTSRRRASAPAVCMHGGHVWHRLHSCESACVCVHAPSRGRREAAWIALLPCGRAAAAGAAAGVARAMHAACRRKRSAWHSHQCSPANK